MEMTRDLVIERHTALSKSSVRAGLVLHLVALALIFPTVVLAQSQTRPVDPAAWNDRLEIGPVAGLTTDWHPAPIATAVPLGTTLRFRIQLPGTGPLQWTGAVEVERTAWSVAEVTPPTTGPYRIAVRYLDGAGGVIEEGTDLDVQALPPGGITVSPVSIAVDAVELGPEPVNLRSMHYFFRDDSIARLTEMGPNLFRTSTNRWMTLQASLSPAGFAPLLEWRLDGVPQRHLGTAVRMVVFAVRSFEIEAGAGEHVPAARLDTYRVRITSHPRRGPLPEEVVTTFRAETEPPGLEDEITWLASTKYGTAIPLVGTGPEFTTLFLGTTGEQGRWLGVRADNAKAAFDSKSGNPLLCSAQRPDLCRLPIDRLPPIDGPWVESEMEPPTALRNLTGAGTQSVSLAADQGDLHWTITGRTGEHEAYRVKLATSRLGNLELLVDSDLLSQPARLRVEGTGLDLFVIDELTTAPPAMEILSSFTTPEDPGANEGPLACAAAAVGGIAACGRSLFAVGACAAITSGVLGPACAFWLGQAASAVCISAAVGTYCACNDDVSC